MKKNPKMFSDRKGQVVTEYIMILTIVALALVVTKIKIGPGGTLNTCQNQESEACTSEYKTIMERMSDSFTIWMQDIFIIISLPS